MSTASELNNLGEEVRRQGRPEEAGRSMKDLVFDPETAAPFVVTMVLTTHDFGTAADGAENPAAGAAGTGTEDAE